MMMRLFLAIFIMSYTIVSYGAMSYSKTIVYAALHEYAILLPSLKTINGSSHIKMMTLTESTHYQASDHYLKENVWVTVEPEFKQACTYYLKKCPKITHMKLARWSAQLLGMSPYHLNDLKIVIFDVPIIQAYYGRHPKQIGIFRPCTDPRIGDHHDGSPICPKMMNPSDPNIDPKYKTWFINNTINSYTLEEKHVNGRSYLIGYPWTGYGYTYNWQANAKNSYGLSEFIILKNTPVAMIKNPLQPRTVYFSLEQYCSS